MCIYPAGRGCSSSKATAGRGRYVGGREVELTGKPAYWLSHAPEFSLLQLPTPQHTDRERERNGPADTKTMTEWIIHSSYWSQWHIIY